MEFFYVYIHLYEHFNENIFCLNFFMCKYIYLIIICENHISNQKFPEDMKEKVSGIFFSLQNDFLKNSYPLNISNKKIFGPIFFNDSPSPSQLGFLAT